MRVLENGGCFGVCAQSIAIETGVERGAQDLSSLYSVRSEWVCVCGMGFKATKMSA